MGRGWRKRKHYPQVTSQQNQPAPTRTTAVAVSQSFSGPLPPPEVLEHYERIAPGTAERLLAMAESQSQHRQGLEKAVVEGNLRHESLGQVFAFIIALAAVSGSLALLWAGRSVEGLTGMLGTLATLAGVFVYGRWSKQRELAEKRERITQR